MRPAALLAAPIAFAAGMAIAGFQYNQREQGWVRIFDGKTLNGWTPKITGYKLGDNFANTFRVKDGAIQVNYDGYGPAFKNRWGYLFYKTPLSNYKMRLEYRFTGEQMPDGPGWAWRNSGVMIHGQPPESMTVEQDWLVSAEVQLLGGPETGERHTGNLCTPGTNVVMDGKLVTQHCIDSNSPTYRGDQWVKMEIEVHGHGKIVHRINGQDVISYSQVQYDPKDSWARKLIKYFNLEISGGSVSLQSESHPVEFRNIEIKAL